jgi:hypothetical protein
MLHEKELCDLYASPNIVMMGGAWKWLRVVKIGRL